MCRVGQLAHTSAERRSQLGTGGGRCMARRSTDLPDRRPVDVVSIDSPRLRHAPGRAADDGEPDAARQGKWVLLLTLPPAIPRRSQPTNQRAASADASAPLQIHEIYHLYRGLLLEERLNEAGKAARTGAPADR